MTEQNQREWPSFGDILSELNSLGQLSSTLAGGSLVNDPAWERTYTGKPKNIESKKIEPASSNPTEEIVGTAAGITIPEVALPHDPAADTPIFERVIDDEVSLPDELPPAAIDTSVLESTADDVSPIEAEESLFDTSALEPLPDTSALEQLPDPSAIEPLPTVSLFDQDQVEPLPDPEADSAAGFGGLAKVEPRGDIEPQVDDEPIETPLGVFESVETLPLAPEPSDPDTAAFMTGVDPFTGEIDWEATDWADGDEAATEPTLESEPQGGIVFPFTGTLPDLDTNIEASQESTDGPTDDAELASAASFDSVATADAIENDLQDLFQLDQVPEDNDNVVPLHPSSDDHSDAVVGLDTVFDHDNANVEPLQEWVGVDPADIGPKDPWAHMRPDEEEDKSKFWANRPKFFGGDDRKAKKKAREARATDRMNFDEDEPEAEASVQELEGLDAEFPCPGCHKPGHVDLEDPLGHKVHLSCGACGQIWSQPLNVEQDQRSA